MQNALLSEVDKKKVFVGKKLKSITRLPSAKLIIAFEDGFTDEVDLLIGADGIGSVARKQMYTDLAERVREQDAEKAESLKKYIPPSWSGTHAYRSLIERAKVVAISPNNRILSGGWAVCHHFYGVFWARLIVFLQWCGVGKVRRLLNFESYPYSPYYSTSSHTLFPPP